MSMQILKSYGKVQFTTQAKKFRKFGVPPGGPLDPYTPQIVRAALAIHADAPIIEVMGSITFEARTPMSICWMTPTEGYVKTLAKYEVCTITCIGAFAGYLGFSDQQLPTQNLRGMFEPTTHLRFIPDEYRETIGVVSTLDISRVGFKFDSKLPGRPDQIESEPVCVGTIQQTPSGQIIVLGPDGPVTGGYRKLGTLIQADLPQLALLRAPHAYQFDPVTLEEATAARRQIEATLKMHKEMLGAVQIPRAFPEFGSDRVTSVADRGAR
jgi:allophanate hydrolase subunit 2